MEIDYGRRVEVLAAMTCPAGKEEADAVASEYATKLRVTHGCPDCFQDAMKQVIERDEYESWAEVYAQAWTLLQERTIAAERKN